MKFKYLFTLICLILLSGCNDYNLNKSIKYDLKPEKKYQNTGFALINNDVLNLKKLDDRSVQIFHKTLKPKSLVKITNPLNDKSLIAEIRSNTVEFSNFYNSVITNKIMDILELNPKEPYIEITLISKNSTFVAGKAKTFEEEREVAEKAPIDGIKISNLVDNSNNNNKKITKKKFSYSIKVADFYYKKSAVLMMDRIKTETKIKNILVIELSKTNYRVLIGPFNDINVLRESFEKMNTFYFENLEILRNV